MAVTEVMFSPIILSFSSSLSWIMEKLYFEILHIKPFSQNDIQFIHQFNYQYILVLSFFSL